MCVPVHLQVVGVSWSAGLKHSSERGRPCLDQSVVTGRAGASPGPPGAFHAVPCAWGTGILATGVLSFWGRPYVLPLL